MFEKKRLESNSLRRRDLNTFFLYRVASGRHKTNLITQTMIILDDNASAPTIKNVISDIFKQRFQCSSGPHISIWSTEFPRLDFNDAASLESLFSEKEVFQALREADGVKIPSPYDFFFRFTQSFYHIFKGGLLDLFHYFHASGEFDHHFMVPFISLIPMVKGLASLNDFYPISLLGLFHKLVPMF